jgi:conjugative transfer signal peptidase TraF
MLRRLPPPLAAVPVAAFLLIYGPSVVRLNLSPSLPIGLYSVSSDPPRRGSLVMVCLPEPAATLSRTRGYVGPGECATDTRPLFKTLAGIAGDYVIADPSSGISINGVLLPESKPRSVDRRGRHYNVSHFRGALASDLVWIHAAHPLSWDSRYYGPIPRSSVLATLKPLLVFP